MYAAAFLALASTVIGAPLAPRAEVTPTSYAVGYLENYSAYHVRYIALECYNQKNTTFFDDCCHPLLASQNLKDDRKPYCTPNATEISSAVEFISTQSISATATASADAEAQSEYCDASNSTSSSAAVETSAVADSGNQYAQPSSAAPTSTWVAPSTTSTQPAATSSASDSGNSGQVMTGGYATYFYQGGNPGACGTVHSDSDKVIAIDAAGWWPDYASNSNSQYCGKWINIKNTQNGKTVTAMVADVCPTCVSDNSLDLSVGAFTAIAEEWEGSIPITWTWA